MSKIEAELCEAAGITRGKRENLQTYLSRLIDEIWKLDNDKWEAIDGTAQEWINNLATTRSAGEEMPDFPDKEPDEVEVEAAPEPVDEAEEEVAETEAEDVEEEPVAVVAKKRGRPKKVIAAPKKVAKAPVAKKEAKVAKPKAAKVARAKVAKDANGKGRTRDGSKMAMIKSLLTRKNGCTARDVLNGTGWKAVGMPAMAKAVGLKLTKSKVKGEVTRYFGK